MKVLYLLAICLLLEVTLAMSLKDVNEELDLSSDTSSDELDRKLLKALLLASQLSTDTDDDNSQVDEDRQQPVKRNFFAKHHDIRIYYDVVKLKNGMVILVPKDHNKNHYFIG